MPRIDQAFARLTEAETHRRSGNLGHAKALCEALLRDYPDYAGALQTLGAVHLAMNDPRQAFSCFAQVELLCPTDWINLGNLGSAALRLGAYAAAAEILEKARQLKPDDVETLLILADAHREARNYEAAVAVYRNVLAIDRESAVAGQGLGDSLLQLGRLEQAAAALEAAHRARPDSAAILYSLSQLAPGLARTDIDRGLDAVKRQDSESELDFTSFRDFARAGVLHRQSRFKEAWQILVQANGRLAAHHLEPWRRQSSIMAAAMRQAVELPAIQPISEKGSPISLFILGPSRAGKSVVEQLLGSLAGLKRGHERRLVEASVRRTAAQSGFLTTANPSELPRSLDGRLRTIYRDEVLSFASGAKIVTDTYPAMISYIGRIASVVPNLRLVFMKRDRHDLALRIFMRLYRTGNHYAYSIPTIVEYVRWYDRLADIWLGKLPAISLTLNYEDVVARPAAALERVARLCDAEPAGADPTVAHDDRQCAAAYREMIDAASR
jgi:tetratricopeptide (TPR) repeat protein